MEALAIVERVRVSKVAFKSRGEYRALRKAKPSLPSERIIEAAFGNFTAFRERVCPTTRPATKKETTFTFKPENIKKWQRQIAERRRQMFGAPLRLSDLVPSEPKKLSDVELKRELNKSFHIKDGEPAED